MQKMPVKEADVLKDLQHGIMYWHGRDRACRPVLVWRMEKISSASGSEGPKKVSSAKA